MNKGSIVERLCSDVDRKEPRYKSPTFTLLITWRGESGEIEIVWMTNHSSSLAL